MSKTNLTKEIEQSISLMKSKNEILLYEYTLRGDKYNLIYDCVSLDMKTDLIIGFEVKISNGDFNNLYRKLLDRDHNYDMYVDKFYICVPKEMEEWSIDKLKDWTNDIAYVKNIGLKVYDSNTKQLKTKINAKQNNRELFKTFIKDKHIDIIKNQHILKGGK